jgi:hypothetical protein
MPDTNGSSFTPTQRRMLAVLSDGMAHSREELHACLMDELGPVENIHFHISLMRTKLRRAGMDIVSETRTLRTASGKTQNTYYRQVRNLPNPNDGTT